MDELLLVQAQLPLLNVDALLTEINLARETSSTQPLLEGLVLCTQLELLVSKELLEEIVRPLLTELSLSKLELLQVLDVLLDLTRKLGCQVSALVHDVLQHTLVTLVLLLL